MSNAEHFNCPFQDGKCDEDCQLFDGSQCAFMMIAHSLAEIENHLGDRI